ncbi:MAG: Sua5/YciO/YrdC/YwlC family protein [Planctomycetes bacterium]|nr:Sua5/YciO/YrdC/YwlC family protein [Planctomycetota bacterium]
MTTVIEIGQVGPEVAARAAREALARGGIVAFPTETVYGLAIHGEREDARQALYRLKGRDALKPLARYVDSAASVARIEGALGLRAARLMRAFWPGPLTLVIERADGSREGYRCSSEPVAMMLATDPAIPVLGTSANLSGDPPIDAAIEIVARLGEGVDLVLDAGRPLQGLATTVLELPRSAGYRILRQGELEEALIRAELALEIVFVCSGNTCRSPLAAAMLRQALVQRVGAEAAALVEVRSAGIGAFPGQPASANSRTVARARGLDLEDHRSNPLDRRRLERADRIYTMTAAHRDAILWERPDLADRVRPILGDDRDVADPFGGDLEVYEACARELETAIAAVMEQL